MGCVYIATSVDTGKHYIGKTTGQLRKRRLCHEEDAKAGSNFVFHRTLRKYGTHRFKWRILTTSNNDESLVKLEIAYIKKYNCLLPNGYNMTKGGDGFSGMPKSPEHRKKISEAHVGKVLSVETRAKISKSRLGATAWNKGMKMSEEVCSKISASAMGRLVSEEAKAKISAKLKGRVSPRKGVKLSEETKQKLSLATKGITKGPFTAEHKANISEGRKAMFASYTATQKAEYVAKLSPQKGEDNGRAILTVANVLEIRSKFRWGNRRVDAEVFGRKYGVSPATIMAIINRRIWKHV